MSIDSAPQSNYENNLTISSSKYPINIKTIALYVVSLLIAISLPITMWVSSQNTDKPSRANALPLGSVHINPEQIVTDINGAPIYLSTLAYDTGGLPIGNGVSYQWGMSSTNSVGTLSLNANDKLATFIPSKTNRGRGDIWVKAYTTTGEVRFSIPVFVGVAPDRTISVISPNGGQSYVTSQTVPITWTATGVTQVAIDIVDADGRFSTIALPMNAALGQFIWTIPNSWYGSSNQFKIKIYEYPLTGVGDTSDTTFSIAFPTTSTPTPTPSPTRTPTPSPTFGPTATPIPTPTIHLLTPNGGETIYVGQQHTIRWDSHPSIEKVTLYLEPQYEAAQLIVNTIPNTGSYTWTVPDAYVYRHNFHVKVYGLTPSSTGTIYSEDSSDNWFTISYPSTPTPLATATPLSTTIPTPTNQIPTATPTLDIPKPNNVPPTISTGSLPIAFVRKPYLASVTATDPDRDTLTMTMTGLPAGLRQGICKQSARPVKPYNSTLTCAITGTTTKMGFYTVTIRAKDAANNVTTRALPLLSLWSWR